MFWIIVIIAVSWVIMIISLFTSPEGWEDKNGFHYGKKDN